MVHKLASFHYVYAINETILYELYRRLLISGTGDEDEPFWLMFKETLSSLLNDTTGQYNLKVVSDFLQIVFIKGLFTKRLYEMIWQPMQLKSYQEQVQEVFKSMFRIEKSPNES